MSTGTRTLKDYPFYVPENEVKVATAFKKWEKGISVQLFHIHDNDPKETSAIEDILAREELSALSFNKTQALLSYELNKVTFSHFKETDMPDSSRSILYNHDSAGFLCAHPLLTNYKEAATGIIHPAIEEWYYYERTKRWNKSLAIYAHKGELRVDDEQRRIRIARFDLWGRMRSEQDRVPGFRSTESAPFLINIDTDMNYNYVISARTLDNKPMPLPLYPTLLQGIKADALIINPRTGKIKDYETSDNVRSNEVEFYKKTLREMNAVFLPDVHAPKKTSSLKENYLGYFALETLKIALPKTIPSQSIPPCPQAVDALRKFGLK